MVMSFDLYDRAVEAMDAEAQVEEMEALLAKIKHTLHSPYLSDLMKLKECNAAIMEAGY